MSAEIWNSKTIAELRSECARRRLPQTPSMSKSLLIELILQDVNKPVDRFVASEGADSDPSVPAKPGWAKIEIPLSSDPGSSNADVYGSVNGYTYLIQRGVVVPVPIKVLRGSLMAAKTKVMREDQTKAVNDPERYKFEEVYSYPFNVYSVTEGPDPRPGLEASAKIRNKYKRMFHERYGYWPRTPALLAWIDRGGYKETEE